MVTVAVWAFGTGYILFALLKHTVGLRVSREEEIAGLDLGEHGYSAYPEFVTQEPGEGVKS
ncbi:Ammonium Transporter Family protein [uncultured archaeon]|nr:Ammonium Transporter Family protein [uncultured archaeon]